MTQTIATTKPPSSAALPSALRAAGRRARHSRRQYVYTGSRRRRTIQHRRTRAPCVTARRRLDSLGRYTDRDWPRREVVAGRRGDGSVLVVDRDALTLGDRRLVAHLAADEPAENAALVCAHYLQRRPSRSLPAGERRGSDREAVRRDEDDETREPCVLMEPSSRVGA